MSLSTNTSPYFDDYNEEKQFHRILFRPGQAIQARELTQLQTILQKQIERHAKHVFVHGARVLDGQIAYNKCDHIKLADMDTNKPTGTAIQVSGAYSNTSLMGIKIGLDAVAAGDYDTDLDGAIITPDGRKPVAQVVLGAARSNNGDPATLLITYESGDEFTANDYITKIGTPTEFPDTFKAVVNSTVTSTESSTGRASYAAIASGVFFINASQGGHFAYNTKQKIILDKYSDRPTYKVGLNVVESIVKESDDITLFDNAQGQYQSNAPGAHRLKIALDLAVAPKSDGSTISPASTADFVELLRIEDGQRSYGKINDNPVYSVLGEALAERTYDESGNYIVDDFDCRVEDGPGNTIKVSVQPQAGKSVAKAYIRGHQYEQGTPWIEYIEKARKTSIVRGVTTSLDHGAFLLVENLQSQGVGVDQHINPGRLPTWDIHTCNTRQVDTSSVLKYNSTRAGRFRMRDISYVSANTHAVYVTDFEGAPSITGNFHSVPAETSILGNGSNQVQVRHANTSGADHAYIGAKLSISYSHLHGDFAGQTRTVIGSVVDPGVKTTLRLDRPFDQPPGFTDVFPSDWEKYILSADLEAAGTGNGCIIGTGVNDHGVIIGDAAWPSVTGALTDKTANGNFSKIGVAANTSVLRSGSFPKLLFKMPVGGARVANSIAEGVTGTPYISYGKYSFASTFGGAGGRGWSSATFRDVVGWNRENVYFVATDAEAYTIINETTGKIIMPDELSAFSMDFLYGGSAPSTVLLATKIPTDIGATDLVRLIGPVYLGGLNAKDKILLHGHNVRIENSATEVPTDRTFSGKGHVAFPIPNTKPNGKDNLGIVDVYRIVDIYDTGELTKVPTEDILNNSLHRVTANYTLDNGQTEEMYDYASVVLKPGAKPPIGQLLVVVDRFVPSGEDKAGFFSVDSYSGQVALDDIPTFTSSKSGEQYKLREYIDYRPSRAMEYDSIGAANTEYYVPLCSDPYSPHQSGIEILQVDPVGQASYAMQFFAPRYDKIVLSLRQAASGSNTGFIKIVSGTDTKSPAIPPHIDAADMTLFTLALPSYTPSAKDISILKEGNRRWSMKDISSLNRRVDRLEYYSTLSMIEQSIESLKIFDSSGQLERFKHGFIVDTFDKGTSLADVGTPRTGPNADFQAAIGRGVLRPAVEQENLSLDLDSASSTGVQVSAGVIHLPYTTVTDDTKLQQIRATVDGNENINPFQVQSFQGTLNLSPSSDIWKSIIDAPVIHNDGSGQYSSLATLASDRNSRQGYAWAEWEDSWFGTLTSTTELMARDPSGAFARVESAKASSGINRAYGPNGISVLAHPFWRKSNYTRSVNDVTVKFSGNPDNLQARYSTRDIRPQDLDVLVPNQISIYDDEISRVTTTQDVHQTRLGTATSYSVGREQATVGEVVIDTNTASYMRPTDIIYRAQGMKPRTRLYPFFDEVDIRPYTERANELVLEHVSGESEYTNPFGFESSEEEIISRVGDGADGIHVGFNPNSNTHYLVNARGNFATDDTVRGSIGGIPANHGGRKVISYKHYSGTVASAATSTTLPLDVAATDSGSWKTTNSVTRAKDLVGQSYGVDLYGQKIYITEGRGYGQSRTITEYNQGTSTLTVDPAWGLTPNTQSRYSIGDPVSDLAGGVYGVFHVPNYNWANRLVLDYQEADLGASAITGIWDGNQVTADEQTEDRTRFLTGNKSFQLRDAIDKSDPKLHSFAVAPFKAAGVIETRQKEITEVFGIKTIVRDISDSRVISNMTVEATETGRMVEIGTLCWADPLAQSILVDPHAYPEGVFIDSVDLWFKRKPAIDSLGSGLPVTVEIRPMIAGAPSGGQLIATTIKYPSQVNVSDGGILNLPGIANTSTLTSFKFDHPIHLSGGSEYAIVLRSDSIDYEVWTAKVGSAEVGTGPSSGLPEVTIDSQPHLGSMFKSQNGTTWVPEVNQDLMFRMHKCKFQTGTIGSAIWRSANAMSQSTPPHTRVHNALQHTQWEANKPKLSNSFDNPYASKIWNKNFDYHRFRVDTAKVIFPSTSVEYSYISAVPGDTLAPVLSDITALDGFTPMELADDTIPASTSVIVKDKSGSFVLKGALTTQNENVSPMINAERLSITMMKNLINDGNLFANTWPANYVITDAPVAGQIAGGGFYIETPGSAYVAGDAVEFTTGPNNIGVGATGTAVVNALGSIVGVTLTNAGNTYLHSPLVAVDETTGSGAVIKYIGEDEPNGPGNFEARYMTKKVPLAGVADARDLRVWLTAAQPQGTTIWVYSKIRNKSDIEPFDDKNWVLMKRMQSFAQEVSASEDDFREISFQGAGVDDLEFPMAYDSKLDDVIYLGANAPSGERYNTFNEFKVKIIMQSDDPRIVPVIRDLRAVAIE